LDYLNKILKLDLHTHVFEEFLPISPNAITLRSVEKLVDQIKKAGLDGIAITEHDTKAYGYRVKEIVQTHFHNDVLIIPGQEYEGGPIHFVELDLPGADQSTFRFIAHPGYPGEPGSHVQGYQGIEIENASHSWHIKSEQIKALATRNNLLLLSNSDAHYLRDIGRCYSLVSINDLHRDNPQASSPLP
jgi:histidinol phosphatase-like PHP family hydrolase